VKSAKTSSLTFLLKLLVLGCLTAVSFLWGASKVRGKDLGKNGIILAAFYLRGVYFTFMSLITFSDSNLREEGGDLYLNRKVELYIERNVELEIFTF